MEKRKAVLVLFVLPMIVVHCDDSLCSDAVIYTQENFEENIKAKKHFVTFFAPWCGHCKRLLPTWDELAKLHNCEDGEVTIAKVDCTMDTKVCADQTIRAYPTMKFFHMELNHNVVPYRGNRDLDSLQKFVAGELTKDEEEEKPDEVVENFYELDSTNFEKVTEKGDHFIKFYAPWCGHCQRLAPTWQQLASSARIDGLMIEKVDCTAHRHICSSLGVQGYPTLLWLRDGQKIDQYTGGRSLEELQNYVTKMMKKARSPTAETEESEVVPEVIEDYSKEFVLSLNKETFDETISEDLSFVMFFVPWCNHCKRLVPTWDELGKKFADVDEIKIAKVDCTQEYDLCYENKVNGYPTLLLFSNGDKIEDYLKERDFHSLSQFVETKREEMKPKHIEL